MNIEEAFKIRLQVVKGTLKHSVERGVIQRILCGEYDNCVEPSQLEAMNDLNFLKGYITEEVPKVGQVWKVKPNAVRSWRPDVLTISYVNVSDNPERNYFTFNEQAETDSCWVFSILENYTLEKS